MTPAEHRAEAERLLDCTEVVDMLAAVAHATLALAPAAAPPPKSRPKPAARVEVFDVELNAITVTNWSDGVALIHPAYEWSTLLDNPAQVRLLADTLTAHADRMETNR